MGLHRFVVSSLAVAAIVWWLNFSADGLLKHADGGDTFDGVSSALERAINSQRSGVHPPPLPQGCLHVLVTGGAGFIGSHAALALLDACHAVTIVDNLSRGNAGALDVLHRLHPSGRLRFVEADLGGGGGGAHALDGALRGVRGAPPVDVVMHFAAVAYVGESVADPLLYYSNITANTIGLLSAMKRAGTHKLVYSSTCAVYGDGASLPITEDTPPLPTCPYGEAKLMAENVIRATARSDPHFSAVILRYFNVYGSDPDGRLGEYPRPELRQHARISGACLDAALGLAPALTIKGTRHDTRDGTCVRDFIHVTDLVGAHLAAMAAPANPPHLFNVATGRGVSVREFVDACRRATGVPIQVVEQEEARAGDYPEVWADPAKIRAELGWSAKYTAVEDGLAHAWAWRAAHPHGYG